MDCFLRDAIFTERFFQTDYDIYYYICFQYIYFQYTTVLCFSIRGGDARISAPSRTWSVEECLEWSLMCLVITELRFVFPLVQVRFSDVKEMS